MSTLNLIIVDASYHRNGICGIGFYAILFDDAENGRMIASIFDGEESGYCSVFNVKDLMVGNIQFAQGNSWRGDHYEDALRPLLEEFLKKNGTNQIGPFALPGTKPKGQS